MKRWSIWDDPAAADEASAEAEAEHEEEERVASSAPPTPAAPPPRAPSARVAQVRHFTQLRCRTVNRYRKLNRIDEGGYGVVYRVEDRESGRVLALKQVKIMEHHSSQGFPVTALRELDHLLSCRHANVVQVYEILVGEKDQIFMAMEFVEHDLKTLMDQRGIRFTAPQVKLLTLQVLRGLSYLHRNWLIHRDLKTSNLLLTSEGVLKVCDFGMARTYGRPSMGNLTPPINCITLPYRAPEGVVFPAWSTYGPEVDIWSVGCVFAEFLRNEVLFKVKTEEALCRAHCDLLGTPDLASWPRWADAPMVKRWNIKKSPSKLRELFPRHGLLSNQVYLTESGFAFLSHLLSMNPADRVTAAEAPGEAYFTESPLPAQVVDLQRVLRNIPSMHELDKRKVLAAQQPKPSKVPRLQ